jgi:hypothetical protein
LSRNRGASVLFWIKNPLLDFLSKVWYNIYIIKIKEEILMENLKMEMGYICDAIKSEDYHTAEDLIVLIKELEKLAYATN